MGLRVFSLLSIMSLLSSCTGQISDLKNNTEQHTTQPATGDTAKELGSSVMVIYHDKKNVYWFGSWETGVYRYDGSTMINYTTKHGLPNNRIDEIKEDGSGNIYLSSCHPSSTVTKFDGYAFTTLAVSPSNNWKLQPNDLWFRHAHHTEKVYRYDGITLYELQLPKPPKIPDPFEVYSIYKDRMGNVWFGTNPSGVCRYNGKTFEWITENDVTEFRNEGANGVRSIAEDANGDFWFNTEYRYSVYDTDTLNNRAFYSRQESIGGLDGKKDSDLDEYISIVRDHSNNLWIATYRSGVWKYDGTSVTHYSVQHDAKDVTVFSIYQDDRGDLWLGTHDNGAYKFNGTAFEKFKL
jgi:ligand-binding sensor domain-containing protein